MITHFQEHFNILALDFQWRIKQLTKMPESYLVTQPENYKAISVKPCLFYLVIFQIGTQKIAVQS